jgi:hypothetical protein
MARRRPPPEAPSHVTLNLRRVPAETHRKFKVGAAAQGHKRLEGYLTQVLRFVETAQREAQKSGALGAGLRGLLAREGFRQDA